MTDAIILSIHPKHCRNILKGKKRLELRTTPNIPRDGCTAYLYETNPTQAIVGRCKLSRYVGTIDKDGVTYPLMSTKHVLSELCLDSIDEIKRYLGSRATGYLYPISDVVAFSENVTLDDLGRNHPPMSYMYLNSNEISKLIQIEATS